MGGKWLQTETRIHTEKLSTLEKKVKILLKDNCGNKNNIVELTASIKIHGWQSQHEDQHGMEKRPRAAEQCVWKAPEQQLTQTDKNHRD